MSAIVVYNFQADSSGKIVYQYVQDIQQKTQELRETFRKTLELIPNGVLLISGKIIETANKEMIELLGHSSVNVIE